ncbi:MAG: PAS domain S-box protein [Methanospirillum sp.]
MTYDAGGRPLRTAGICVDITERKHAEETLREREQQLEFALEGAGAGMWVRDRDGRWIATPQMNALFGLPHDAPPLREEEFPAFIHPDDLPALGEAWLAARENCSKYSQEYRAIWPDGSVHWLASKGRMAADAGDARRFIGITYDITERKRVEKALRETAERYQQALESPLVGFAHCEIVVDRNGAPTDFMYLDVNPTFEAFTGLSREKVLHRRVTEVLDPSEVADIIRLYGHVAQSSEPTSFEYPIPSLGKWFEVAAFSPQRDQFFAFFTDITRRKRAEGALRKSEARQALLAEVAGRLLAVEEPQGVVDDPLPPGPCVPRLRCLLQLPRGRGLGRARAERVRRHSPEEAGRIRRLDLGAAVCGCAASDGCRIVAEAIPDNPDPRTDLVAGYGVRAYACHPLLVAGRSIGTLSFGTRDRFTDDELATMRTIADLIAVAMQRIADRDSLRTSEERLRLAQESAGIGIWDHDLVSDRVTLSPMFLGRYGMTASAVAHYEDWGRLIHPDDRERVEAERRAALIAGRPLDFDLRVILSSGEERWVQFRGRGSANGPGGRVLGVVIDVTARKQAETALERYAADLRASNEDLERSAYASSHDLQEPLRSIVSFSQLLERRYKGQLDAVADDYIRFIVDGGNRMQALIRDLLKFSRIETQAREPVPTDAGAAVRSALRTLEASAREGVSAEVVGPLPTVMADPVQLEQVFTNLIGNAIKYRRPDAPIEIAISAKRLDGMWEFAIRDNGIGIEGKYFGRIFEMFRRLHPHDKYGGTGIGLAVVKRIVERHGGMVRVESTPGEGSTLFFTLPAA